MTYVLNMWNTYVLTSSLQDDSVQRFRNDSLQDDNLQVDNLQDSDCKRLWYSLQDVSLQGLDMVQFARHKRLWYNLQDMGMDAINKNMVHSSNQDDMWIHDDKNESA